MEMLVVYSIFLPLRPEGPFLKRDIVLFFPKTRFFFKKTIIWEITELKITAMELTVRSSGLPRSALLWVLRGEAAWESRGGGGGGEGLGEVCLDKQE